jgi:hypothetical protein
LALRRESSTKIKQALAQKHPPVMALPFKSPGDSGIAWRMTIDELNGIAVGKRLQKRRVVV